MDYLGIDPGFHGGAAWIGRRLLTHDWGSPGMAWKWLYSRSFLNCKAVLERVTRPCKLVGNAGEWRGFLIAAGIDFVEVRPQVWQKHFGLTPELKGLERKKHLMALAQKRYPRTKVTLVNADAILLAVYAKEVL